VLVILISPTVVSILALVIIAVIAMGIVLYIIGRYNSLLRLKNDLERSFSSIDVLLKQRHDELPKLIQTCRAYMHGDQKPIEALTQARAAYARSGTPGEKAQADNTLTRALGALFSVGQKYPELKANANFIQLQKRMGSLGESIGTQRRAYNENVNAFNARITRMPDALIARFMKLQPRSLFQTREGDGENTRVKSA
jgi:LemA protein